jgi:hypothetical protein
MEYDLVPPLRYGVVNPSVYRGGYPTLRNFRFLSRLRLKTIISLTPEPPTEDLKTFAMTLGAKIVHIKVLRNGSDFSDQLKADLVQAVNVSTYITHMCTLYRYRALALTLTITITTTLRSRFQYRSHYHFCCRCRCRYRYLYRNRIRSRYFYL